MPPSLDTKRVIVEDGVDPYAGPATMPTRGVIKTVSICTLVLLTAVILLGLFGSAFDLFVLNSILLACIGAMALNLLTGGAGQVSVGNAAFLVTGAFGAVFALRQGAPFPLDVLAGAAFSGCIGLIVGLPAVRIRGLYLIMSTLAANFIVLYFALSYQSRSVGAGSFLVRQLYRSHGLRGTQVLWSWTLAVLVIATAAFIKLFLSARTGRAWQLIRHREDIAPAFGVNPIRVKLSAFVVSSFIIGLQGALMPHLVGSVSVDSFNLTLSITYLAMIVIGGLNNIAGSILGASIVVGLPLLLPKLVTEFIGENGSLQQNAPNISLVIYGILIMLFVTRCPDGIAGWTQAAVRSLRRGFSRRRITE